MQILLIEDNPGDVRLIQEMINDVPDAPFDLIHANDLAEGLEQLEQNDIGLILLDLTLPDSKGLETIDHACARAPGLPIVVLTGLEDENLAVQAMQHGAQDYLVKGRSDSHQFARSLRYSMERKRAIEQLRYQATHDRVTGLPNRFLFEDRLEQALNRGQRRRHDPSEKWGVAVFVLDLDRFKQVNDTLGHATGDLLLHAVADRILTCIRKNDTLARLGGDEFTLVLTDIEGKPDCSMVAQKISKEVSAPFLLEGGEFTTSASIGISLFPGDGDMAHVLLKRADIAMYQAKQDGSGYRFYSEP